MWLCMKVKVKKKEERKFEIINGGLVICKKCKTYKLYVYSKKYETHIKCPECNWIECIHSG